MSEPSDKPGDTTPSDGEGPADPAWQKADLGGLRERLVEAKTLLEQALAVGLAEDMARLEALAELEARSREDGHGGTGRRRYR